ncbi:MFS transporter [Tomitella fengzijianii]|uniref:MFS transporter n=1 Tax=Tomitella fengzijianii TaxID=2597660 RepID=A0A516X6Z8_9ACTN|nr:MFS transporter [Tomitella fengzijianii]QDQ98842.1 MFS transporter [Tomitella fengzijianii]
MTPTTPVDTPGTAEESGWSPRLAFSLFSIVLVLELLSVSYMMIAMALPDIAMHYQTTQAAWLITAFLLLGAVAAPLVGKLADIYGKRKLLIVCLIISALGSLMSALAGSYALMIAGRALAGMLVPCLFLSYSLIRDVFPSKTVPLAVSIATAGMGLITIAAPFLTGWLIDDFGWRSIFWFFTGTLVVLGVLVLASTPESAVRLRSRVDFVGAILLGAGIAGVLVAVSFGPTWGWGAGSTLLYLFGGVVLLGAWLASSRIISEPLMRLDILRLRPVLFTVAAAGAVYGATSVYATILPSMAMTPSSLGLGYGFGVDAEGFAIFQVPIGALTMVGGIIVGLLCARGIAARTLLINGSALLILGGVLTALENDSKGLLLLWGAVFGLGTGLGYAAIPNLVIKAAPPELQASTASMTGVSQSLVASITPVIAYAVMNNSFMAPIDPQLTGGAVMYTEGGFVAAFLVAAGAGLVALIMALGIPRVFTRFAAYTGPSATEAEPVAVAAAG